MAPLDLQDDLAAVRIITLPPASAGTLTIGGQDVVLSGPGANNTLLVSGGGMRTGQVVGSTNKRGEHPQDRPLTPNDLWATVLKHLGIDQNHNFLDHHGRPLPILPYGEPIRELGI